MPTIKRALISVSDKTGVVEFAKALCGMGVVIISTGGTAKALRDAKIKVVDVSDYTGSPEILDGRLKTLHPKIHGGLLGIRNNPEHVKEMKACGIEPIDMVVANLYPFEATVAKEGCTFEKAIENIDIGGPTMLRAAAKNWQDVAVVVDPVDYRMIIEELTLSPKGRGQPARQRCSGGALSPPAERGKKSWNISRETCFKLAQKVFATTARYDAAICNYINSMSFPRKRESPEPKYTRSPLTAAGMTDQFEFPSTLALTFTKVQDLRYGENPHQKAAFYKDFPSPLWGEGQGEGCISISSARQLHGKELSYNNIMDADAAIELAKEFADKTAAVVIKHTNPCGVACITPSPRGGEGRGEGGSGLLADAFVKARDCDPASAFGGIVALTRPVDEATAKAIGDTFFEVIIAPGFEAKAFEILKAKKNLRLLEIGPFPSPSMGEGQGEGGFNLRNVRGGLLVQEYDDIAADIAQCKVVTKRKPTKDELTALDFAWRVVKHVKSNAIVISVCERRATNHELRVLGIGAGQTSRVDSVKIAIMKQEAGSMKHDNPPLKKGGQGGFEVRVLASDAFFPFRDSIDLAAKAGITAVIQPGGSIRDDESINAANEHGMAMIFTNIRHFLH